MELTSFKYDEVHRTDVTIAENYLNEAEKALRLRQ
ncbi:MAG TPA: hypothetical protein VJY99_06080 [Buttiauxella sp.]|nr:hypothetical protein [Buttiauxella sp.]HKM96260.1 hypothetical protein [Buttiauxella sp.]